MSANQKLYDVIISGAGPVGLFLACELGLQNCSVLVIEKSKTAHAPFKKLPFGIRGLSAPTIEALDRRDLLNALKIHKQIQNPHSNVPGPRQAGHFAGIGFLDINIDATKWPHRLPSSTAPSLISEIEELETVFAQRAKSLGVEIIYDSALADFQQTESVVTVYTGNQTYKCKWLVGCDGARSVTRKLGGFEFVGTEPEFTGYTFQADIADSEKLKSGRNQTANGMYLQSQPGYIVIQDFDSGAFHGSEQALTREHLQLVLRRISETDVTIKTLHLATCWTDRARLASRYRNQRVILAGDAAHIHSPLGGQGLNLGLGDAMNLGYKLAAVLKSRASERLLDSYQSERQPIAAQVLDWSRAQVALMKPEPAAQALYSIVRDLINTRDGATYFAGRVWGLQGHYRLDDEHPLIGYSSPNFEFLSGAKLADFMHNGQALLIDFGSTLKNLASAFGKQVKYVSGPAKNQLSLTSALIRPDGIIAWATNQEPNEAVVRSAAQRLL